MDCREIRTFSKQYDAIICGFCLPYLSKEESVQLISDASALLKQNGVMYLSTMEDDYEKSGLTKSSSGDELYMYYHEADYLTDALNQNSFTIIDLQRQQFPTADETEITDLIILARKN